MRNKINYILIIVGALIAFYAKVDKQQNEYLLIGGMVILMLGIYRIARNIPSKSDRDDNDVLND